MFFKNHSNRGFSFVEVMIVITIIGVLSVVALTGVNGYKQKARNNMRIRNLDQLKSALALYYDLNNKSYPKTCNNVASNGTCGEILKGNGGWIGICPTFNYIGVGNMVGSGQVTDTGVNGWIHDLAPDYILKLPRETSFSSYNDRCYIYKSDGKDYKVLAYQTVEGSTVPTTHFFYDPNGGWGRPSSYAIYTPGARVW
jgi:prepilin-type N-terminal cleavage/methylation domain-containing protein